VAGIGFGIRDLLRRDGFLGFFRAYAYAGVIGSGPWILSFAGILLIHILGRRLGIPVRLITQFQTSVTYVIAVSLVLSGALTLAFTRFASDRIYEGRPERVGPAFLGALTLLTAASGLAGLCLSAFAFPGQSATYRLFMIMSFVAMNGIWLSASLLSGIKRYLALVGLFGIGYAVVVAASLALRARGLEGLLGGFLLGHFLMLAGMLRLILRAFPAVSVPPAGSRGRFQVSFEFLRRRYRYPSLVLAALAYNLGIWADKAWFWFAPHLGQPVIGLLRSSLIYDIPIFLSYVATLPGMAVFLVRMETDFAEKHRNFYGAIHAGATLGQIAEAKDDMVDTIRQGLLEIAKIQGLGVLFAMIWGPAMLRWLGISQLYQRLLYIDVVAAGLQVVFLGLCNVLFYLDKRRAVLGLSLLLLAANLLLTMGSVALGAEFYGYGFAAAMLLAVLAGLWTLDRNLHDLEFRTFMGKP
jgi:polysaccharide biosynthesis protein PelG